MSDSDDSDTAAVRRNRSRETALFRDASSSPPPNPQKTKRPAPRFLGDNTPDPTSPSAAEDLFADLDDLPNDLDVALPKRIDVDAFEKLLGANVDKVDNEFNVDETGEQVDEVKKKKRVVAKMDDVRLLGENGFPKLIETIAKFRPGAKGNEVCFSPKSVAIICTLAFILIAEAESTGQGPEATLVHLSTLGSPNVSQNESPRYFSCSRKALSQAVCSCLSLLPTISPTCKT